MFCLYKKAFFKMFLSIVFEFKAEGKGKSVGSLVDG